MSDAYMLGVALLLGLVEGATEFLPVSSTGHLILASALVGFTGPRAHVFQIFIQLGAVLAVVWNYRQRFAHLVTTVQRDAGTRAFALRLGGAFAPFALAGYLFQGAIKQHLFKPATVAAALIAGGLLILVVEALPHRVRTHDPQALGWAQALGIGLAQCLALWPGISRSAATILGGLVLGFDRRAATEFSFFLAVPTLGAATLYELWNNHGLLAPGDAAWLVLAFVVSFVVALAAIRWLLRYVSTHSFGIFAWYRIVVGLGILLVLGG